MFELDRFDEYWDDMITMCGPWLLDHAKISFNDTEYSVTLIIDDISEEDYKILRGLNDRS
jgi:hypothetical protein